MPRGARRDEMRTTFIFVTVASLLSAAVPAPALNCFELEVYPATTEGQGLHEVENLTTFVAQGRRPNEKEAEGEEPRRHRLLRTTVEYNYGLTDKIDVAAYTDLERLNGDELEYAGSRVRARGGLFEKGRFPLDLGWYIEAAPYPATAEARRAAKSRLCQIPKRSLVMLRYRSCR